MGKALLVFGASALLLAACGTTSPPQGQTPSNPSNVSDLVGARGSSFDGEMQRRGFVNRGGYQGSGRAASLWYNAGTRQCLEAVTTEGRVQAINPVAEGNCR